MKQYCIVYKLFQDFTWLISSESHYELSSVIYNKSERNDFLNKWSEWKNDPIIGSIRIVKVLYLDLEAETVVNITDKYEELVNAI